MTGWRVAASRTRSLWHCISLSAYLYLPTSPSFSNMLLFFSFCVCCSSAPSFLSSKPRLRPSDRLQNARYRLPPPPSSSSACLPLALPVLVSTLLIISYQSSWPCPIYAWFCDFISRHKHAHPHLPTPQYTLTHSLFVSVWNLNSNSLISLLPAVLLPRTSKLKCNLKKWREIRWNRKKFNFKKFCFFCPRTHSETCISHYISCSLPPVMLSCYLF